MPESTIRVLRDDCSCTENLVGIFGRRNPRWKEELHVSVGETFFERKNILLQFIVRPKVFSFPSFFLQMAAKSSSLSHVSFLESMMRTKSTRALSFFLSTSIFAGQNDQLRLKSSKTVLKAFQLIFPWLKMKWKTLCILNLDS